MADRDDIVDIEKCDLVGDLKLEVNSRILPHAHFNSNAPVVLHTYYMESDLLIQITYRHNPRYDMIEAYLEVLKGPRKSLTFKIKYGFAPFQPLQKFAQQFIYTATNTRSAVYSFCPFRELVRWQADNELRMRYADYAEFICSILVSPRDVIPVPPSYRIPTVNGEDCDHRLIIQNREIKVHKRILKASSRFFYRRFMDQPHSAYTVIDNLDVPKRIEKETLVTMLRYMYGMSVSDHNLQTTLLLIAAREYEVTGLFRLCEQKMITQMSKEMAPELFYIGKTERAPKLAFAAAKFILANFWDIRKSFQWDGCTKAFPRFFEPILRNPYKYFREIIHPEIRSRSADDVWTAATFVLRSTPEIAQIRPMQHAMRAQRNIEASRSAASRSSVNTSAFSCESLEPDLEPMPRKRSSPVITRRRTESDASKICMKSLAGALSRLGAGRNLNEQLRATESQFEANFGPVESAAAPESYKALSRSVSLPSDNSASSASTSSKSFSFYDPNVFAMECREDSNFTATPSGSISAESMGAGTLSGERSTIDDIPTRSLQSLPSLPSMTSSLEFAHTYSLGSDSVFEHRESPKSMSKVLTPPEDMSVSEITSENQNLYSASSETENPTKFESSSTDGQDLYSTSSKTAHPIDFESSTSAGARPAISDSSSSITPVKRNTGAIPKVVKQTDFQNFAHPDAQSLSDVSSIPLDSSASVEPESNTSSKTRSRREKRMKKSAEKTRKFLTNTPQGDPLPYDFSTSDPDSILNIPRPSFIREYPTERPSFAERILELQANDQFFGSSSSSSSLSSSAPNEKKATLKNVTFGQTILIADELGGIFVDEPEPKEVNYYENWVEAAKVYKIQDVFEEPQSSNVEQRAEEVEDAEKAWDEKDEDELTAPLLQRIHSSSSGATFKNLKKESQTSSVQTSASRELPLGGGVIRKRPGTSRMSSVEDPMPLSSSESPGTTSSSLLSSEPKNFKRTLFDRYSSDNQSTIERGQSFGDLRTVRRSAALSPQQQRNTSSLAGTFSIGMQENLGQPQEPTIQFFEEFEKGKKEKKESHDEETKVESDDQ